MRISISNIAWDIAEDDLVAELLAQYRVDAIDIAPGKYFPETSAATVEHVAKVKAFWATKGVEITGMQSLLYGTQGLNVFGSLKVQKALLKHLNGICQIAARLGATRLVFGSPKNRDRSELSDSHTLTTAVSFFRALGDIALNNGVMVCLESNPVCYGANFMTSSVETLDIVEAIKHPAIKMQLDTGAMAINRESIQEVLCKAKQQIGHIHISEPNLAALGDTRINHREYAQVLRKTFDHPLVCIEMVATKGEPHIVSIERALKLVTEIYRDTP